MALRVIKQIMDEKVEVYYEHILKLTNYLNHKAYDNLLMTFFRTKLVPYLQEAITWMKQDILFFHNEVAMTCKETMGDANEYWKLLKLPPKF